MIKKNNTWNAKEHKSLLNILMKKKIEKNEVDMLVQAYLASSLWADISNLHDQFFFN